MAISREDLQREIDRGLAAGGESTRAFCRQVAREPVKWQLHPWGDDGGGFWVVGVLGDRVVWFNDIEGGFNVSTFEREGEIPEDQYFCNQDELHWSLEKLRTGEGQDLGPPRAP